MSLALTRSVSLVLLGSVLAFSAGCLSSGVRKPTIHPVVFEPDEPGRPMAKTPVRLAVARVGYPEDAHYRADDPEPAPGVLSVYETPETIAANEFASLGGQLSGVRDVIVIQPDMAVNGPVRTPGDLRGQARHYRSDLVLAYSVSIDRDTDYHFPVFAVLTLGLAPNATSEVEGRAQGVLIDARSGYIYDRFDTTSETWQLANAWSQGEAEDQSQKRVERRLLAAMLEQVKAKWPGVVTQMATSEGAPVEAAGSDRPTLSGVRYSTASE